MGIFADMAAWAEEADKAPYRVAFNAIESTKHVCNGKEVCYMRIPRQDWKCPKCGFSPDEAKN